MLHGIVAMRGLIAMGLAAIVGSWGLHAYPVNMTDPFLGLIEARSSGVFVALIYGYSALWFTTPFFGASLVLSLFAIAASRRHGACQGQGVRHMASRASRVVRHAASVAPASVRETYFQQQGRTVVVARSGQWNRQ